MCRQGESYSGYIRYTDEPVLNGLVLKKDGIFCRNTYFLSIPINVFNFEPSLGASSAVVGAAEEVVDAMDGAVEVGGEAEKADEEEDLVI